MRKNEAIFAGALIIISIAFFKETFSFPVILKATEPGPSIMPRIYSIILFFSAIYYAVKNFRKKRETSENKRSINKMLILAVILTFLYILLIPFLGYFISTVIYLLIIMFIMEERKKSAYIILPSMVLLFSYLIFYKLLLVQFPLGIMKNIF